VGHIPHAVLLVRQLRALGALVWADLEVLPYLHVVPDGELVADFVLDLGGNGARLSQQAGTLITYSDMLGIKTG
jgi:hypothetical protein